MTVTYRDSMIDTWHYLSYLSTKTIMGRCLLAFILVAPIVGGIVEYHIASLHQTASLHHTSLSPKRQHFLLLVVLLVIGGTYAYLSFCILLGLCLGTLIIRTRTFTIDPEYCRLKTFMGGKIRWTSFSSVIDDADYFYFVGWSRIVHIPKRAFDSSAEAYAFFETALGYWRKAKGIAPPPTPDTSGVWPPAPRVGDSQELGEKPKH